MKGLVPRPSSTPIWEQGSIALWESTLLTVFELVVDNIPLVVWCENWLRWAWWQLELDLEGPRSRIWREYGVDVEWFSKTEKNFSLKERKAHFLSLTQYSLGVELKFVECVNFCCWAWLKYAVTLKENPLNVTWFWWAWLKSLLTLIKNLLNVKTILLLEFCTIWLSIADNVRMEVSRRKGLTNSGWLQREDCALLWTELAEPWRYQLQLIDWLINSLLFE